MALRMYSAMVFGMMRLACIRKRKMAGCIVDEDRAGYRWGY